MSSRKEKLEAIKKHIRQKKEIQEHIDKGGSIDDLDKDEYGFKQPI